MMAGLSLITAAIVHWNTVYLDRTVRQLRAQGMTVPGEGQDEGLPVLPRAMSSTFFDTGHSCGPGGKAPDRALGSRAPKIAAKWLGGYAISVAASCR